ncbi:PQQ-dependent sugar dehydrogenase [Xanthomarina sp. F2636L]|uniref:PQQ-dependent sugar dehydrogenase n=1 Tax=Xanthomarina sp. F2636L TaxID=2996018 RepID=UPI00225E6662|nr:PQQ-dependent sugar dehydrogenase [Xanthomarina sp. F2636L]MCX7550056.1 PQQ-dependent sugar dehydrogenase [Xanthomarina sp. F2636L]
MKSSYSFILIFCLFSVISCGQDKKKIASKETYQVVVPDLNIPWGFAFLPDNSMLITEKKGELIHFIDGKKTLIEGLPEIEVLGQGGLMDIELHPDYKDNGWIYISYASPEGEKEGCNTAIMRAKIENNQLINKELLYKASPNTTTSYHFGSRIIFDNKGYLYFTIGDRGEKDINPQDLTKDGGKVYRLYDDGRIPEDNPFYNTPNAKKAIYTYGNRNPQGMKIHPKNGEIWTHEHGPKGGDEINIINSGKNYGWPKVSYGVNYVGTKITDYTELPGMESPIHYWVPSIAPSGMAFISSDIYPEWKGNLLVGSLKFQYVSRCILKEDKVLSEEKLLEGLGRVRSIEQGLDGYMYVGVENLGIVKLLPEK